MTSTAAPAHECWVVTDGAAGNERQAVALAQALDLAPEVLRVALRAPWRWLAPSGPSDIRSTLSPPDASLLHAPWPKLVIGCGRIGAGVALGIGRLSNGHSRLVQILDPRRHRGSPKLGTGRAGGQVPVQDCH